MSRSDVARTGLVGNDQAGSPALDSAALSLRSITKRFGQVTANDHVDFELRTGEVHVLLGENGAGKSTLMNMLYGHLQPDEGTIDVRGRRTRIAGPAAALALGIGMVHQHFSLVPSFTVAENVVLGGEPGRVRLSQAQVNSEVQATVDRVGWDFDVRARTGDLPVSGQQRVEILKLLHRGADILLLDEPTALLAPAEIDSLLESMLALRAQGSSIVLVTHKLREVTHVADRVTVLRSGKTTGVLERGSFDETALARAMTGRDSIPAVLGGQRRELPPEPMLIVKELTVEGEHGKRALDGVTFEVRPGEVVGIAGVEGNGQHELVEALAGLRPTASGSITIAGSDLTGADPLQRRAAGLSIIPADRRREGVVGDMTLVENFALTRVARGGHRRAGLLRWRLMRAYARQAVKDFDIRPGDVGAKASSLSGGNMQKLVIARELSTSPSVLVASSPTWGLDVGAVADVQRRLLQARDDGCAVVLQSLDLDEVIALSDRIIVLYRGCVTLDVPRNQLDHNELSLAMIGKVAAESGTSVGSAPAAGS